MKYIIVLVILVVIGFMGYQFIAPKKPIVIEVSPPDITQPEHPVPAYKPEVKPSPSEPKPKVADDVAEPEPVVNEESPTIPHKSKQSIQQALLNQFDPEKLESFIILKQLVYNFVVTIDNMTSRTLPHMYRFTYPPKKRFVVDKEDKHYYMSEQNQERYTDYVAWVTSIKLDIILPIYIRYYALFQSAYEELGYPDSYFNDRFITVIEHLLPEPTVTEPIRLVRPKVFYEFADPQLESLSAGQKLLIRMGKENAMQVRAKLKELREALTHLSRYQ